MKRPAFQFYPADWRKDTALKLCSLSARGLWIEMICIMHMAEPYGHLCAAGRPLNTRDLSKLVGESERDVKKWLEELKLNEVCGIDDDGGIFSRRMVRDENLRDIRAAGGEGGKEFGILGAEHGSKGGRPRKGTGDKKPPLNPPPSSSSASSSSKENPTPDKSGLPPGFAAFWETWPAGDRKEAKAECLKKWNKHGLEAISDQIVTHVLQAKQSKKWTDGYEPAPLTYINQKRWQDGENEGGAKPWEK